MLCKNYTGVSSISSGGLIYIRMSPSPYAIEIDFENTTITGDRVIFYVTAQTPDMATVGFRNVTLVRAVVQASLFYSSLHKVQ